MSPSILRTIYCYSLCFIGFFVAIEMALEYRHYQKGFTTPIFGKKSISYQNAHQRNKNSEYGPSEIFPFKSKIIAANRTAKTRIWIASASHAEGGRVVAERVFPNKICEKTDWNEGCESINGSKAGMSIENNIELLKSYAEYQPDYALLYQLSMVVAGQQKMLSQNKGGGESTQPIIDFTPASKFLQSLSLYGHLSDFIGGYIKLSGQQKNILPSDMNEEFKRQVLSFITFCRSARIQPVIMTFSASHSVENISNMPFSKQLDFVKYNNYLSPKGWINMVEIYNDLLRNIAKSENVPLVDLALTLNGKTENFIDFVHFNEKGHQAVADYIASEMTRIKLEKVSVNDI